MFNTELGYFCATHDNWAELLSMEPYFLKIKEDGPYVMFSYDQIRSCFMYEIVREARGIIFRKGEWETPVCWAFNKFGNYGEDYVPNIDWNTAFVSEKIDGSLIKVWHDCGWNVSTNGTIDAFKADIGDVRVANFGEYFINTLLKYYNNSTEFYNTLNEDKTYMFELVGPYNRVVVPYDEPAIYFLGARNKYTGEEFNCSKLTAGALGLGKFKRPVMYSLTSLDDCIKAADLKSWDDEGFVVCDARFNRCKIKSPAYVLAHFMRNNNVITRKHLVRVVLENEVAEFLCYAKDYEDSLRGVQKLMNAFINIGNSLAASCRKARQMPRKAYSELVMTFPKIYQGLLFFNYEQDMTMEEYTSKWSENKWEEYLEAFENLGQKYFNID